MNVNEKNEIIKYLEKNLETHMVNLPVGGYDEETCQVVKVRELMAKIENVTDQLCILNDPERLVEIDILTEQNNILIGENKRLYETIDVINHICKIVKN